MNVRRRRFIAYGLSGALIGICALWFSLPWLLGVAARHWLAIPGVEGLEIRIADLGASGIRLHELRGTYHSPTGDRLRVAFSDVEVEFAPTQKTIRRVTVGRGEIEVSPGTNGPAVPWPPLRWPEIPLREARFHALRLVLLRPALPPIEATGALVLEQDGPRVEAEFRADRGTLRSTLVAGESLDWRAEWLVDGHSVARATVDLARDPASRPARFAATAPVSVWTNLGSTFGATLPFTSSGGEIALSGEALPGEMAGTLRAASGEIAVTDVSLRLPAPAGSERPELALALAGRARFSWQPMRAEVNLQSGFAWQLADAAHALTARGRLEREVVIQQDGHRVTSEARIPFSLQSSRFGRWEGAFTQLGLGAEPASGAWATAGARLQFSGRVPAWVQDGWRMGEVAAQGSLAIQWSLADGLRSTLVANLVTGESALTGATPIRLAKSSWTLSADGRSGPRGNVLDTLQASGELRSPQLAISSGSGQSLSTGPVRLQLLPVGASRWREQKAWLQIAADAIHGDDHWPSPDLRGRLLFDREGVTAEGNLALQGQTLIGFSGAHRFARQCGEAVLTATPALASLDALLKPRPATLSSLVLASGEADARINLDWCASPEPRLTARGALSIRNAALGWEKARAEGIDGVLQMDSLAPPQGRLQLTVRRGQLATGTELADLVLDLALLPKSLQINALQLDLLGGQLRSEPQTLPWPLAAATLPLELRRLDLGQALHVFSVPGLSGSGFLTGELPLILRAEHGIEIEAGHLDSLGAGHLSYAPAQVLPDNPGLQALRNLQFKTLALRLWYAASGAYRIETRLEGHNPDFYNGYPVRFGLTIHGELPGLFRSALFSGDFNRHILEQLQSGKLD